jgi:hypothetical protein
MPKNPTASTVRAARRTHEIYPSQDVAVFDHNAAQRALDGRLTELEQHVRKLAARVENLAAKLEAAGR